MTVLETITDVTADGSVAFTLNFSFLAALQRLLNLTIQSIKVTLHLHRRVELVTAGTLGHSLPACLRLRKSFDVAKIAETSANSCGKSFSSFTERSRSLDTLMLRLTYWPIRANRVVILGKHLKLKIKALPDTPLRNCRLLLYPIKICIRKSIEIKRDLYMSVNRTSLQWE